ncbi:MAG: hypothetical protein QNJ46_04145 [Leptolyngbyaceae cyanobacterium MO_188.B28]|nr:hypothetical protein [Leptolyngbyaceae cyanobacterium MO_188.B28]
MKRIIYLPLLIKLFDNLADRRIDYLWVGGVSLLSYTEGHNTSD